jgi:hypothetical protein
VKNKHGRDGAGVGYLRRLRFRTFSIQWRSPARVNESVTGNTTRRACVAAMTRLAATGDGSRARPTRPPITHSLRVRSLKLVRKISPGLPVARRAGRNERRGGSPHDNERHAWSVLVGHSGKLTNNTPGHCRKIKSTNDFLFAPGARPVQWVHARAVIIGPRDNGRISLPSEAPRRQNEPGTKATTAVSFSRGSGKARPGLGRGQLPRRRCY